MITKFEKYNESIKSLLVGPTKEEICDQFNLPYSINTPEEFLEYIMNHVEEKQVPIFGSTIIGKYKGNIIYKKEFLKYKLSFTKNIINIMISLFDINNDYDVLNIIQKYFRNQWLYKDYTIYELDSIEEYHLINDIPIEESVKSLLVGPNEEEGWSFLKKKYKGKGDEEYQLLINACKNGIMIGLKEIFDDRKISVNFDNYLPMRISAQYGQVETMKFLQERGADIHANGDVPLLLALDSGEVESVKYILDDNNIDMSENMLIIPISDNDDNVTLIKILIEYGKDFSGSIYLKTAVYRNNSKIVKLLLETYKYDKNIIRTLINYVQSNYSYNYIYKNVELLKKYLKE